MLEIVSDLVSTDKRATFQELGNKTCIPSVEIRDKALEETVTETSHMLLMSQMHPTLFKLKLY